MIIENIEKTNVFNFGQLQGLSEETTPAPVKEIKDTLPLDGFNSRVNEEEKERAVSEDEIDEVLKDLEKFSNYFKTHLNFSKDESTGITVVKIINSETEEVIRQIPSEEILKIASKMQEVIGVLFDKEY